MNKYKIMRIMSDRRFCAFALILFMVFANIIINATASTGETNSATNNAAQKLNEVFCNIAHLIFMIAGALAALVIILAGLRWITAADDPGARNGAKTTIISAIVGLIIIMVAVYIVQLVIGSMMEGVTQLDITKWISGSCKAATSTSATTIE